MQEAPLMPKATAVWLVENTALSFDQIAEFCKLHPLEVKAIADGESAQGIKGLDPVITGQLSREEIAKGEANPDHRLKLAEPKVRVPESKRRAPRYTPLSKRQDRPAAILWLVKFHPELADAQIRKLVGTTNPSIQAIRERTHWNINNIQPIDPVALGLCRQSELDSEVQKAARKRAAEGGVMNDDERRKLVSTEQSLEMAPEPRLPRGIQGLETFSLTRDAEEHAKPVDYSNADSFFNLPEAEAGPEDDDEDEGKPGRRR